MEAKQEKQLLEDKVKKLERLIEASTIELEESKKKMFEVSMRELCITEIYRLAKTHFPRLRKDKKQELNPEDILELDKWIQRSHSLDSLKTIIDALQELDKYRSFDIKKNVYALVQKIIMGGSYHGKKR